MAFHLYVTGVVAIATVVMALLPWHEFPNLDHFGLFSFIALGILSEVMAIDFSIGQNRTAKSSIAFLPLIAAAVTFPPIGSVIVVAAVHCFTELLLRERALVKTAFNIAQGIIAIGLSATVYYGLGGESSISGAIRFLPFIALALTFFSTNLLLVSAAISVRQRQPIIGTIRKAMGPAGGNILYDLLASPVAVVAAILYRELPHFGLLLIILPLLLIRSSYQSKVKLQQANRDLLRVLIKAIETRDPYTSGHSVRVSTLARMIATDLRLSNKRIEQIETAALLHDVGKIDALYAAIIRKPTELTDDERDVIRTHATKGAELLEGLTSFDEEVIQGVRHHHERYDGNGYPDGLAGQAIPLAARIIMLCDSIDAMLSDRPYRPALSTEMVHQELRRCSGTQFDPKIVEVIIQKGTIARAAALINRGDAAEDELVSASQLV
jgi:putative nucleotidyltransferase with HDIG domain